MALPLATARSGGGGGEPARVRRPDRVYRGADERAGDPPASAQAVSWDRAILPRPLTRVSWDRAILPRRLTRVSWDREIGRAHV